MTLANEIVQAQRDEADRQRRADGLAAERSGLNEKIRTFATRNRITEPAPSRDERGRFEIDHRLP